MGIAQQVAWKLQILHKTVVCTGGPGRCHDTIRHFSVHLAYELQIHMLYGNEFTMLKNCEVSNAREGERWKR